MFARFSTLSMRLQPLTPLFKHYSLTLKNIGSKYFHFTWGRKEWHEFCGALRDLVPFAKFKKRKKTMEE